MNKLIIIGNGFDKAHSLPTSYLDFLDSFWKDVKNKYQTTSYQKLIYLNPKYEGVFDYGKINSYDDFKTNLSKYAKEYSLECINWPGISCKDKANNVDIFKFKNSFFRDICSTASIKKWVDVEDEYYKELTLIPTQKANRRFSVSELNEEFEQIKSLLNHHLLENVKNKYDLTSSQTTNNDWRKIYEFFKPHSIFNNKNIEREFTNKTDIDEIKAFFLEEKGDTKTYLPKHSYILNFNYTNTPISYIKSIKNIYSNNIHGVIDESNPSINFGYGDEMDENYSLIENLNDNEYLKNFKSFQYLQNESYKNALNYIDSQKFQVYIMGHSCGLSDRTLLKTIFEHENCRSIKVFYHEEIKDGKIVDDYTNIIQNISRHFTDKPAMRKKIVNKSYCEPLPQGVRFPEKENTD
ncbi:MAG: hypothetical protein H6584_00885 [Flavobacteriales bacterium]|nr:hypothetical protein [Flavobacteriales bacterium]